LNGAQDAAPLADLFQRADEGVCGGVSVDNSISPGQDGLHYLGVAGFLSEHQEDGQVETLRRIPVLMFRLDEHDHVDGLVRTSWQVDHGYAPRPEQLGEGLDAEAGGSNETADDRRTPLACVHGSVADAQFEDVVGA
jgi:hypothetical protein